MSAKIVEIQNLTVNVETSDLNILDGIDVSLDKGEILGVVGESGSGKSMLIRALLGLLPSGVSIGHGSSIKLNNDEVLNDSAHKYQQLWGKEIGFVPQDPMTSLNPVRKIGSQITDGLIEHAGMKKSAALRKAIELLKNVGIHDGERMLAAYPHQLSGGMRQRVLIAMAISLEPKLLIADEPTTALDVTIQKQILDLLKDLRDRMGLTIVTVSHDLTLMEEFCDRIVVMYCGRVAESLVAKKLNSESMHPYTRALLASHPKFDLPSGTELETIRGEAMSFSERGAGCAFAPRCKNAIEQCFLVSPPVETVSENHTLACFNSIQVGEIKPEHQVRNF